MSRIVSRRPRRVPDERGVALLVVLLVVTLLTVTVMEFTYSVMLDQHRVRNAVHALQANLLARSGINLAEGFLLVDEEPNFDSYTEEWWLLLDQFCQEVPLDPTMRIKCRVSDESGKINVNLTRTTTAPQGNEDRPTKDAYFRDAIRNLFEILNIKDDQITGQEGRLRAYWLREPPASTDEDRLRPKGAPNFGSIEDFAREFGIPTEDLGKLRPFLTAQPTGYLPAVNINTAPKEVLLAMTGVEEGVVAEIQARQQEEEPFVNAGQIREVLGGIEEGRLATLFNVRSSLFQLQSSALANVDPLTLEGGIGQTLSVLVVRRRDPRLRQPDSELPGWTSRALDWQKEAGARLMQQPADDEESRFDRLEENDRQDRDIDFLNR